MYKETLDVLMEDINDHNNIKETILKNQLQYHFTDKNKENKNVMDNAAVIVRRILSRFPLGNIIGIQPITSEEIPTIKSSGLEYEVEVDTRPLQCGYPCRPSDKELETQSGLDLECEINYACSTEIEIEIVAVFLHLIGQYATEINIDVKGFEDTRGVTDAITAAVIDAHANWIVVPALILAILQSDKHTKYKQGGEPHGTMGDLMHVGQLTINNKEVTVYCSLWGLGDTILVGSKDMNNEDTPIVYAPKTMLVYGDKMQHPDTKEEFISLMTQYAKFIHHGDCQEQYRKIIINFLEKC